MPFDDKTRSRLQRFVSDARRVLTDEFTAQLQNDYGLDPVSGNIVPLDNLADDPRKETARQLRQTYEHYLASTANAKPAEVLDRIAREQAFTILNRLVALRMCEARKLLLESIAAGTNSRGFQLYQRVAGAALGDTSDAYRHYLLSIFDEFAVDLGVLFHRFSPMGLLFPREGALLEVLALINDLEIGALWGEDETIGWLYQYFNSEAERKKMREKSSAPRNSRELAVRNQFFTPRYVVEFLTDNTLGRLWYEMRRGKTALRETCTYLVRRPTEIFLEQGEVAPDSDGKETSAGEDRPQGELLQQPVYIPHRPLKDPREIRLLDPACGSMHFGLYAFDLLTIIYDESWESAHSTDVESKPAETFVSFVAFVRTFPDKVTFLREVPRLIVEHNIHGIDIDPRAVQIAGLSLWLRAQRAWHDAGFKPAQRPGITRSNLVCAEPMPGEKELLREFVEQQFEPGEQPAFCFLLETIFDRMTLAGEAGSLLRIEEEIRTAVADAKRLWQQGTKHEQVLLFAALGEEATQVGMRLDLSGITDEQFWGRAEQRIYDALEDYARKAENGVGFQRRLFADDAAQGFAFIDVCRNRYDVVVMNPPFGRFSKAWEAESKVAYPNSANDILGAFVEQFLGKLTANGRLGAITSRTCFFLASFKDWRLSVVLGRSAIRAIADLGQGVMDNAMVEAAAYVLENTRPTRGTTVFRAIADSNRKAALDACIYAYNRGVAEERVFLVDQAAFQLLPNSPFVYWISGKTISQFKTDRTFEPDIGDVRVGLQTGDDPRYVRAVWEVAYEDTIFCYFPTNGEEFCRIDDAIVEGYFRRRDKGTQRWAFHVKSGASQPWYSPITLKLNFGGDGAELRNFKNEKGKLKSALRSVIFYYRPGFSWTRRAARLYPYVIAGSCIPSVSRYMAFPRQGTQAEAIGVCASRMVSAFLRFYAEFWQRPNFLVDTLKTLPWPSLSDGARAHFETLVASEVEQRRRAYQNHEPFHEFVLPVKVQDFSHSGRKLAFDPAALLDDATETMVAEAFGFSPDEARVVERDLLEAIAFQRGCAPGANGPADDELQLQVDPEDETDDTSDFVLDYSASAIEHAHLSYVLGCVVGRWDIRYATGERQAPELLNPFAPLPVCPPGMLQGEDGLPIGPEAGRRLRSEGGYPLDVAWDGILVDDPEHPFDIERRVRAVLAILWGDRADTVEQEACSLVCVPTLREWLRRPSGFFADHLKRYSKSRRQAPIFWPLSTTSGSYTLWIYYHRLTDQTLFACVNEFVEPKLLDLGSQIAAVSGKGGRSSREEKQLEELHDFVSELEAFRDELLRLTKLPWKPNLNDGVQITAAPLWKLFRLPKWQKTLRETWQELERGDYDWAHLAYSIWPDRVREQCKSDKSLAIAHGLEDLYVEPPKTAKKKSRKAKAAEVNDVMEFD